jgi:hypothetical protein
MNSVLEVYQSLTALSLSPPGSKHEFLSSTLLMTMYRRVIRSESLVYHFDSIPNLSL